MTDDWTGEERRREAVSREEVNELREEITLLIRSVDNLANGIEQRFQRRSRFFARKRHQLVAFFVVYTLLASYGIGVLIDDHVQGCMVFGSVTDEVEQRRCNLLVPFHDHPIGGISNDDLDRAIERVRRRNWLQEQLSGEDGQTG